MKTDIHSTNFTNLLARLFHHISQRRRRQFILLLGLMFMSVFAELISLGAVLPFLSVLLAPDRLFSQPFVRDLAHAWGITSADQLVLPLTVLLIVTALAAGVVRLLLLWVSTRGGHRHWCRSQPRSVSPHALSALSSACESA